uniref:Bcl-2 Bcl-2 homology region 1-3 domain-containing protein n=1 Tax=Sparus aurata TaxID=8175 RepID=A0A671X3I9_SPAAU
MTVSFVCIHHACVWLSTQWHHVLKMLGLQRLRVTGSETNKGGNTSPASEPVLRYPDDKALDTVTRQLMKSFLGEFTGLLKPTPHRSKALWTMKRVVDDILKTHKCEYNGMIDQLSLDKRDTVTFVSAVANSLFSDGTSNWGRVASLTAFGAVVCQYFKDKGRDSHVEMVAEELASYLLTKQKDWLINNNYWVGGMLSASLQST